jgi:hypothetical protein
MSELGEMSKQMLEMLLAALAYVALRLQAGFQKDAPPQL